MAQALQEKSTTPLPKEGSPQASQHWLYQQNHGNSLEKTRFAVIKKTSRVDTQNVAASPEARDYLQTV